MGNDLPTLWNHQISAISHADERPHYALFFEMGTGKTATMIQILRRRYASYTKIMPTLILCPKIVVTQWKNEFLRFSKIPADRIHALTFDSDKCIKVLDKAREEGKCDIVIVNYDKLTSKNFFGRLQEFAPFISVMDESHYLKSPTSKRSKLVEKLTAGSAHRYLMTGTPILNSALDVFQQFKIMDRGETFGDNFFIFRDRYFMDKNAGWKGSAKYFPQFTERKGADREINQKIYATAMRVTKDECLDLPPIVRQTVHVELSPEQRRIYDDLKRDFISHLDSAESVSDRFAVATTALTKALRMQQVVTGHVKDDQGGMFVIKDNPRIAALEDLLESLVHHHKVIVWCSFVENYKAARAVCERLKVGFVELHGEISDKDRIKACESLNNDPDVRVVIANQAAAGTGINLTAASYSIYFSKTFNLAHDLQSESRNHRGGSEVHEKITRIDIVSPGTIDEVITEALAKKIDISNRILELRQLGFNL